MVKVLNHSKIQFLNDSLLIDESILVFSDFHIGYEETVMQAGIFPRIQLKEILLKLKEIFWDLSMKGIKIKKIIILGDLKHEFGEITDSEWRETLELIDYLIDKVKTKDEEKIILIKGNHDNILGPIAKKRGIILKEFYNHKNICFFHGDKLYLDCLKNNNILVLGHLHPAITLEDKYKKEKYKCFLEGKWKNKQVFILPSFSPISFGYDLKNTDSKEIESFSIIPTKSLKKLNVVIYNNKEKKEYNFGKLGKLSYH